MSRKQKAKDLLEDVMRRSWPDSARPDAPPRDLELIALRYVDEREAAQKLVRGAAEHLLRDPPRSLKDEREAAAVLTREIEARGSTLVFKQAYKQYRPAWYRYGLRLAARDPGLAEDIVEEAVAPTLGAHPDFTDPKAVNSYVRRAMRTAARKLLKPRRLEVSLDAEDLIPAILRSIAPSPQRQSLRAERARRLQKVLDEAPREAREAYLLHELAQPTWTIAAIAEKQNVTPRTVSNRLHRMRVRLLACLED
jgi:RNA polymerase sigma factor (sigma-70 family)